jgi:23S rRNA pseudouridine2605 synthase
MRLNQYLAKQLGISRRQADEEITKGKILVNGTLAILGQKIEIETDKVEITTEKNKKPLSQNLEEDKTILFYKPIFCVCTRHDPQKRKTVYNFLPREFFSLKSAGRLDYMSEGLLVMSNNGDLIHDLTHPSNNHQKNYLVGLKNQLDNNAVTHAKSGQMEVDDYKLNPVTISKLDHNDIKEYEYLKLDQRWYWYKFELSEGRNNQIRKMCQFFGQNVLRLIRISHGKYELSSQIKENIYIETDSK